ncbi:amidoligase family protein [Acuticoccus kandeliae]|uniref:amidoligase family protein n=1 Tax=Acuticoccus kandeliae TaxID=2073160 RepID=UPI000D3EBD5D|nr:amidoligase family protein [Acuticoccus kandeliae]
MTLSDTAMLMTSTYDMPPRRTNATGEQRGVGVEIEFSGLSVEEASEALNNALGGHLVQKDSFAYTLKKSDLGEIKIKLDSRLAHKDGEPRKAGALSAIGEAIGEWFAFVAEPIIPGEIVTGPIPVEDLPRIDKVTDALRDAGAEGVSKDNYRPLALHLNPEIPDTSPETVMALIKAFAMMDGWLREQAEPDRVREMMNYFRPYPDDYVAKIADPAYWPAMDTLIDDYIAANPTRDRDLDMLPLLRFLDEDRVVSQLPDEKIGCRPTSHYRLPDSRIGDPGWSVATVWNKWVVVERVADDCQTLDALCKAYLATGDKSVWPRQAERIALG